MTSDVAPGALPLQAETALAPGSSFSTPIKLLLLLIASAIPAFGALCADFYYADDLTMITKNPYVTGDHGVFAAFTKPYFNHYGPLHILAIKLQYILFGPHAPGFRVFSILLHFCAAAACCWMLNVLTRRPMPALGISLLWAMHPIQSESVAWIVEQKTLLCGLFSFLAIAVYADAQRPVVARIFLALLLTTLGCLAKSPAIVVFPIVVLIELFFMRDAKLPLRLARTIPFALLTVVFVQLALWAHEPMERMSAGKWTKLDAILNMPGALMIYLRVAFLPWTASFFQDMDRVRSFGDPAFFVNSMALPAIAAAFMAVTKPAQRALAVFCALAWVAGIGPMLNFSLWNFPAYDRFQYIGMPFLFLGAAVAVENLLERAVALKNGRKLAWTLALVIVGMLGLARGFVYGSEETLARDAVARAPHNAYSHAALANTLYPEYLRASKEQRRKDQLRLAEEIGREAMLANECWNFRNFFHSPVSLLLTAGEVLHECEMYEPAEALLHAALADDTWAVSYKKPTEAARKSLLELKLQVADRLLNARVSMEQAEPAIRLALQKIEESRAYGPPRDESWLLEAIACEALARLKKMQHKDDQAAENIARARQALDKIPESSPLFARVPDVRAKIDATEKP